MSLFTLITSYYKDKNNDRQIELDTCIQKNLDNSLIENLILVLDSPTEIPFDNEKLIVINLGKRPNYRNVFNLASTYNPTGINILANTDIYFTEKDLNLVTKINLSNRVLALSRWDVLRGGNAKHFSRADSQDTWIWVGKIKDSVYADFQFGKAGCDNRIAYELDKAGYEVVNCSKQIKSFHLHITNIRNYDRKNPQDVIPPPYKLLPINDVKIEEGEIIYISKSQTKEKLKIFHVALHSSGIRQKAMMDVIRSLGSQYIDYDWLEEKRRNGVVSMRKKMIQISESFKPDFTFMQIQSPDNIDYQTCKKLKGFVMNWTGDVRQPLPKWFYDIGSAITTTSFTNLNDVNEMRSMGFNSDYLQVGFDPEIYSPKKAKKQVPPIVFMGNNYPNTFPLSPIRHKMVMELHKKYGKNFGVFGNNWEINNQNLNSKPNEEALVYSNTKIAINCSHFDLSRYSSDRLFRILGCGSFCLARYYPDCHLDFIDGEHLVFWTGLEDLFEKIDYYLSNEYERQKIAHQGMKYAHENHTWMSRRPDFVEIFNKYSSLKIK